ncbi:uncharacterized protein B0I36DRAFT_354359 [Microdochium trichocladiopsis]|uniref:Uncharacterized protein n=1 Tax=Microdochium trichocladiopsis TaxID=1682393 RepID=A0A9P8XTX6_9PEZI|nr:uncharacterized protein B0I36DRAFT_354359 [Microdochium trichocladiopsis]KAH7018038.1 hypothetical protein B0I36DRAFT_354359 [Microdochium trichocladiopsis]
MKTSFALASLLSVVVARPATLARDAAVPADGSLPAGWNFMNYRAECIPRSTCSYSIDVVPAKSTAPIAHCSASGLAPLGTNGLPTVASRTCDDNSFFAWAVYSRPGDGQAVQVIERLNATTSIVGTHQISQEELQLVMNGAAGRQKYIGPETVTVPTVWGQ